MADNDISRSDEAFRLPEYLGVLRDRKWTVIVITMVAVVAALVYAQKQTPLYRSEARILATNPLNGIQGNSNPNALDINTEKDLVTSSAVSNCAVAIVASPSLEANPVPSQIDALCRSYILSGAGIGVAPSASPSASHAPSPTPSHSVSPHPTASHPPSPTPSPTPTVPAVLPKLHHPAVSVILSTDILSISYSSPRPLQAQLAARAFALAYISFKRVSANAYLNGLREPYTTQLATLQRQLPALIALRNLLFNQALLPTPPGNVQFRINSVEEDLQQINNQVQQIQTQLIDLNPSKLSPPQLEVDASLPTSPSSPNKPLIAAVGLLVGLAFGIGLALLRERLDTRLRGRRDLEEAMGVPVLAVVPHVPGWRRREDAKLITVSAPKSAAAEAYRSLRTSILFAGAQRGLKVLMVTSPVAGEGKSTTAANLAVSLAESGRRIILVSADLRKPRLHKFFGMTNDKGLTTFLTDQAKPWEVLQDPSVPNLRVIESGPTPGGPSELLQSEQMGELLTDLREMADFVVLDTAPVLLVSDALGLAPLVDGVLFVADAESTSRPSVSRAREQLEQVGAPLIGSVLNNFQPGARAGGYGRYQNYGYEYGYGYGYGQGYYSDRKPEPKARRERGQGAVAAAEKEKAGTGVEGNGQPEGEPNGRQRRGSLFGFGRTSGEPPRTPGEPNP